MGRRKAPLTGNLRLFSLGLKSFLPLLKGHTIKWYADNQSVSRIVEIGSMKEDL